MHHFSPEFDKLLKSKIKIRNEKNHYSLTETDLLLLGN